MNGVLSRVFSRSTRGWWIGGALVVLMAILPLLNLSVPGIFPGPTYTPGTLQLLALAMLMSGLALSYHLLFGVAGMLSFGHALFFAAGAYGLGIVLKRFELELLPAIVLVLVGGIVLANVLGAISLRVTGITFAMVTLAFAQAGSVMIRRNSDVTGGDEGLSLTTTNIPDVLVGVLNTRNLYWLSLAVLILVFVLVMWFEKSQAGHVALATRENELRVRVLGVRPYAVRLITFVLASTLAVIVGMAYLLLQSGVTTRAASSDLTLTILVIVVLGGVGSRWGAVIGGVVYTLLDQRLTALAASEWITGLPDVLRIPLSEPLFLLGTLFILVVLFLPGGITGAAGRIASRRNRTPTALPMEELR